MSDINFGKFPTITTSKISLLFFLLLLVFPLCISEWVKSLSRVWLFANPWTVAYQVPPSMGFSRQEYWSGLPFPSPGDLPDPGIEPGSPTFQAEALTSEPPGKLYAYVTPFVIVPQFLYFSILFSVCISVWGVYKDISSCSVILALAMSSLLMSPLKTFFILVQWFWFLRFPLDIFLEFPPLCLHSPCSLACYLLFSIGILTKVINILKPLSDYFHNFVISESGSNTCLSL